MKYGSLLIFFGASLAFAQESKNVQIKNVQLQKMSLSLEQAEKQAVENSPNLKSAAASKDAAASQALTSKSLLWPRLSIDGYYFYQTEVPEANLGFGKVPFGTHDNYALGPVLSYTLFDGGRDRKAFNSLNALGEAREADYEARRAQLKLNLRVIYFRVQQALKNLALTADALRLSLAQNRDIDLRFKAGAASRLDQISSHKDTLSYQMRFNQAQTDLARTLRDLFALIGTGEGLDTTRPVSAEVSHRLPQRVEPPTLVIDLDQVEQTLKQFTSRESEKPASDHPEIVSLQKSEEASRYAAESARGGYWPKLQLQAKSQILYPNLVIPEQAHQNTLGVNLSFPIFEGNLTPHQISQRTSEAMATAFQREQRRSDFDRDWLKIQNVLTNLRRQQKISQQNVEESHQIEKLTYDSYRSGRVRFLDVQSANFRLLEAQVDSAQIDQQILEQTANLEYLAENIQHEK